VRRNLKSARATAFERELIKTAERGFALNIGALDPGLNSVAVAIQDPSGRIAGGLNLAGTAAQLPRDRLIKEVGPALLEIADAIPKERYPDDEGVPI
jgi:DNA-binding IclR family transcriptional regulator